MQCGQCSTLHQVMKFSNSSGTGARVYQDDIPAPRKNFRITGDARHSSSCQKGAGSAPRYTKFGSFQTRLGPELECTRMISLPREKTSGSQVTHDIVPHASGMPGWMALISERGVKARARRSQDRTLKKTLTTDTFRTAWVKLLSRTPSEKNNPLLGCARFLQTLNPRFERM
jgi:hypothetical protein